MFVHNFWNLANKQYMNKNTGENITALVEVLI